MIKFTVFGDLHYDEVNDGDSRISEIIEHLKAVKPDFAVSLGDLCRPVEENRVKVLCRLNEVGIPIYHTIGNHETDVCNLHEVLEFLGVEQSYYSFEVNDVKFIILDSCFSCKEEKEISFYKKNYKEKMQNIRWFRGQKWNG